MVAVVRWWFLRCPAAWGMANSLPSLAGISVANPGGRSDITGSFVVLRMGFFKLLAVVRLIFWLLRSAYHDGFVG